MSQEQILQNQPPNNKFIPTFGVTGLGQRFINPRQQLPSFVQTANQTSNISNAPSKNLSGKLYAESEQKGKGNGAQLQKLLSEKCVTDTIDLTESNVPAPTQQFENYTCTSHATLDAQNRIIYSNHMGGNYQKMVNGYHYHPQYRNATDFSGYQERSTHDKTYTKKVMNTENNTTGATPKVSKNLNTQPNLVHTSDRYYQPVDNLGTAEHNPTTQQAHQLIPNRHSVNIPIQQGHISMEPNRIYQNPGVHYSQISQKQVSQIPTASGIRNNPPMNSQIIDQNNVRWMHKHPRSYENHPQDTQAQNYNGMTKLVCPKQPTSHGRPQETGQEYVYHMDPRLYQGYNIRGVVSNSNQPQLSARNVRQLVSRNMMSTEGSLTSQGVQTQQLNLLKGFNSQDQIANARSFLNESQHPIPKQFQKSQAQTTPKPTTITDINSNVPRVHDVHNYYSHPSIYQSYNGTYPNEFNAHFMENIYLNAASSHPKQQSYQEDEKRKINHIKENLIATDPYHSNQQILEATNHTVVSDHNILRTKRVEDIPMNTLNLRDLGAKEIPSNYAPGCVDNQGVPKEWTHILYRDEKGALHQSLGYGAHMNNYQQTQHQNKNSESPANQVVPTTNSSIQSSPSSHKNNDSPGGDLVKRRREEDQNFEEYKLNDGHSFYTH